MENVVVTGVDVNSLPFTNEQIKDAIFACEQLIRQPPLGPVDGQMQQQLFLEQDSSAMLQQLASQANDPDSVHNTTTSK